MTLYRKRPLVVEARQFNDPADQDLAAWCGGCLIHVHTDGVPTAAQIDIPTLEGTMSALLGDWIVRGVAGEFYPVKDALFPATFEPLVHHGDE